MAIWTYVGLPRNGKTYNVVAEQIIPALKQGRRVVTNIPLLPEGLAAMGCDVSGIVQLDNASLEPKRAGDTIREYCTPGSLCVFDELWRFIPQGVTPKNMDPAWQTLFAEHGHRVDASGRMMQIVLVVQDLSMIAAFARSLVERTCVVTKLETIGASSRYRVDVYQGHVTGLKPPIKKRISEEFGSYDPAIFKCYVSRTMAEGSADKVDEKGMSSRGSLWRNPALRFGVPIAAALIGWGLWRSYVYFFPPPPPPRAVKAEPVAASVRAVAVRDLVVPGKLRVAAVLRADSDADSRVLLDTCDGQPSRWVRWFSARCIDDLEGGFACEWKGQKYEFRRAIDECRITDERGSAQVQWFPTDGAGSSKQIPLVAPGVD